MGGKYNVETDQRVRKMKRKIQGIFQKHYQIWDDFMARENAATMKELEEKTSVTVKTLYKVSHTLW